MPLPASMRMRKAVEALLKESAPSGCPKSGECFQDGRWGWLAYDDEESNACGGKPWGECFCATDVQRQSADELMGKGEKK